MRSAVIFCRLLGISCILLGLEASADTLSYRQGIKAASIYDFPFFASIEVYGKYACAATIIDDKYVMTSYSCVKGIDIRFLGVRAGTSHQGHRGEYYRVVDISSWKDPLGATKNHVYYDVAMVEVAVSFSYTPLVMWANPNTDGIKTFLEGALIGWADTEQRGSRITSANAYVLPSSNCSQIYSGVMNITKNMFCLLPTQSSNDLCFAGMGAPFYFNEQFYGLVTYNPGCDQPDMPVVITGVSELTTFIITVLCNLQSIFGDSPINVQHQPLTRYHLGDVL